MSAVAQLRPYNQGQLGMAFQRTSWGLRGLDPTLQSIMDNVAAYSGSEENAASLIAQGAITPASATQAGIPNGLGILVVGFIAAMAMGLFEGPRKYGR